MTRGQMDLKWAEKVTRGNREAMDWLANWWSLYVHQIDDIIDGERTTAEEILATFALAIGVYSHPFYLQHLVALRQLVLNVTNLYADSVQFERSDVAWQREWSDHNRHAGQELVLAVACICGGYQHMRTISAEQRVMCHSDHHDREGKPN